MTKYLSASCAVFLLIQTSTSMLFAVPSSPSLVTTNGRSIILERRYEDNTLSPAIVFTINGLDWNPVPVGSTEPDWANYYTPDINIMSGMNASVVRTYGPLPMNSTGLAVLDYCYEHNIYMIMDVGYYSLSTQAEDDAQVAAVVNFFKNHPAILMFEVGNEWNYNFGYNTFGNSIQTSAVTVQHIAGVIKANDNQHAVTSSLGSAYDSTPFGNGVMTTCSDVDVWGYNTYAIGNVAGAVTAAAAYSPKPYYFSEIGTDAFNGQTSREDQADQATYELENWSSAAGNSQLTANNGGFSGELFFEFSDEWWKASGAGTSISTHDNNGSSDPNSYDDVGNEEWYGFVDINRNPRQVCSTFQTVWAGINAIPSESTSSSSGSGSSDNSNSSSGSDSSGSNSSGSNSSSSGSGASGSASSSSSFVFDPSQHSAAFDARHDYDYDYDFDYKFLNAKANAEANAFDNSFVLKYTAAQQAAHANAYDYAYDYAFDYYKDIAKDNAHYEAVYGQ